MPNALQHSQPGNPYPKQPQRMPFLKLNVIPLTSLEFSSCENDRHLRTLNPHLEHAMFDAHFETEPMAFVRA